MNAVSRFAVVTADVRMTPAATPLATGIKITPINPVSTDVAARLGLESPHQLSACFTESDVPRESFYLTVAGKHWPIKACGPWSGRVRRFRELILEDVKNVI